MINYNWKLREIDTYISKLKEENLYGNQNSIIRTTKEGMTTGKENQTKDQINEEKKEFVKIMD